MRKPTRIAAGAIVAGALALAATGAFADSATPAASGQSEGPDTPISGGALDRASEAALAHIGQGSVTDTEVEDEESYYEVEVTRDDGSQVDVQLDREFSVVGTDDDGRQDEGPDDD